MRDPTAGSFQPTEIPPTVGEILIVDDSPSELHLLSQLLSAHGYRVRVAVDGAQGLRAARLAPPDLILLDVMMPGPSGYEVCRQLKEDPRTQSIPVLFLSALDSAEDMVRAFESGGEDYVTKPFESVEVLARVRTHVARQQAEVALREANRRLRVQLAEIQTLQARLQEQAIRDPLTGLFNRRYLEETLEREISRAAREGHPIAVVMIDLDCFKDLNDRFGHGAGDLVLRAFGDLLRAQTRGWDIPCRYGGDELLVVLLGAPLEAARQRAEQWRVSFEALPVPWSGDTLRCTASLGVAASPGHGATGMELLREADRALYAAKAAGRNRVVACPSHL